MLGRFDQAPGPRPHLVNEERSSERLGSVPLVTQPGSSRGGTQTQACEPPESIRAPCGNPEVIMSPRAQGTLHGGQHTCAHTHTHAQAHTGTHTGTREHTVLSCQTLPRTALGRTLRCSRPSSPPSPGGASLLPTFPAWAQESGPQPRVPLLCA